MNEVARATLTERQRCWLEQARACEAPDKTVAEYAAKQGSSAQAVYAGKTLLVRKGVPPRTRPLRFQRAQIAGVPVGNDWRIQRMYLNLNKETTKPPGYNFLQQQDRFDDFIEGYNYERPHQALGGKYPGEVYTPSLRE
jgi:hypothetical protein